MSIDIVFLIFALLYILFIAALRLMGITRIIVRRLRLNYDEANLETDIDFDFFIPILVSTLPILITWVERWFLYINYEYFFYFHLISTIPFFLPHFPFFLPQFACFCPFCVFFATFFLS